MIYNIMLLYINMLLYTPNYKTICQYKHCEYV